MERNLKRQRKKKFQIKSFLTRKYMHSTLWYISSKRNYWHINQCRTIDYGIAGQIFIGSVTTNSNNNCKNNIGGGTSDIIYNIFLHEEFLKNYFSRQKS